jgi:DNA repair exonuclease SbcCD ATPase subunit
VREATYQPLRPEAPPLIRDAERERDHLRPRPTPTEQLVGTTTDSIQNSRIEALEQALRQLSSQLTSERKSLSVSLQDIQRDLGQRRDDELRYGATIGDRVAAVEAGIERRLSDLAHKIESLSLVRADSGPRYDDVVIDRIASIEASIEQRLADLGRAFNSLQDRIQSLDSALAKRTVDASSVKVDITPLQDRIAGVERLLQTSTGETSRGWATVAERIKTLEATLFSEERIGTPAVDLSGLTRQLAAIERNLASGAALKVDLAPLGARLEALEQLILERAAESPADFGPVAARIGALENQLTGEIRRISSVVDQSGEMERRLGQFLGQSLERQRGELVAAIGGSLSERLDASVSAFDPARHLTPVADRLGILERNLTTYVQKVQEQATTYDQDLGEIQDVLIKLHGQQQAMASAAEQWRNEVATEMTAVGTRLSTLERMSQRPAQLMESMNGRIDTLYRLVAEKVERRNRFVYWLFGTNDWLAASWPDRNRTNAPPQA